MTKNVNPGAKFRCASGPEAEQLLEKEWAFGILRRDLVMNLTRHLQKDDAARWQATTRQRQNDETTRPSRRPERAREGVAAGPPRPIAAAFLSRSVVFGLTLAFLCSAAMAGESEVDVCVYGGTSGGVIAAVESARMGKKVALVVVNNHLGGMTSGGLGETDIGRFGDSYIQGVAREFYQRIGQKYGVESAFNFEPHVAEAVFEQMAREAGVKIFTNQVLSSVLLKNKRIVELRTERGDRFRARVFIDASYEGDLLARAGVTYTIGREAASEYGEPLNGIRPPNTGGNQFEKVTVNPYVVTNDAGSGLLPLVQSNAPGVPGDADRRVQAYNFRMCLTRTVTNQLPITAPRDYHPEKYELMARYIEGLVAQGTALTLGSLMTISHMPNDKTDINNSGAVSTDFIGESDAYPEADAASRRRIWQAHKDYIQGLFYFLATDPRVPAAVRSEMQSYGLCKDEFSDNAGWPWQLYVREARRMVSDYVMTESNCLGEVTVPDSIGLAAYNMDSHNCQRVVVDGAVRDEGDVQVSAAAPYPISYRSIVPRRGECQNLLVPWCLSASHMGFGSIRMEPVFMILGQAAGTAACLAIDESRSVQDVSIAKLQKRLVADKQLLHWRDTEPGLIVDNTSESGFTAVGLWSPSTSVTGFYGPNYLTDNNTNKGQSSVTFTPKLPRSGSYRVYGRWTSHPNRARRVPVEIVHRSGTSTVWVDQTRNGGQWVLLLTTDFDAGTTATVQIRNAGTSGFVVADAIRFVPEGRDEHRRPARK
ncbi:MAG TPA: FAD-dependent oxidoreductase [Verrucomicrobiae bacterium]|nr:FAD-dependent oxidoreductase [Verrucomicrobiae bacterium]